MSMTSSCAAAASSIRPRASTAPTMSRSATAASPRWRKILPGRRRRRRSTCRGKLVLPGLIDTHAHVFQLRHRPLRPRRRYCAASHSGVTTLVDQGGPSVHDASRRSASIVVKPDSTRVLAFISAYLVGGLEGHYYPELYRPDCIDVDATVRAARENATWSSGVKAPCRDRRLRALGRRGDAPRRRDRPRADLPLYIHFGQLWPLARAGEQPASIPTPSCEQVLKILRPGDILAHPFTRHPGGFVDQHGKVHPMVREALARGLKTDVGHGSHFSFKMARMVLDAGIVPDTLGADMHGYNTDDAQARAARPRRIPTRSTCSSADDALLAGLGHDPHAGARPAARAGRADGDQQRAAMLGMHGRDRHAQARRRRRRVGAGTTSAAAWC